MFEYLADFDGLMVHFSILELRIWYGCSDHIIYYGYLHGCKISLLVPILSLHAIIGGGEGVVHKLNKRNNFHFGLKSHMS